MMLDYDYKEISGGILAKDNVGYSDAGRMLFYIYKYFVWLCFFYKLYF